ncbi:MAG: L-lactate dehydrogenase [Ktedonobacterales bacterium]|jgi:isopentenyl diphosphate isomerase/L-lactate dehydrogenase-like FMN-dependent dehydrogenase|nr:MAG: L-lactate dehydrogenase [Ktedonobacterales bacterium]
MEPVNVREYEALAQARMDPAAWDYYRSGAEDEVTVRANCDGFARIRLRPRMLVDVTSCDTRTTVVGTPVSMPILIAPTAYHCLACEDGECATARAAGAADTLMVASTLATRNIEAIAAAATGPLWFQLYVYRDRAVSESLVRRAEAAGYRALVLTVDTPRLGRRERDIRNAFSLPPHLGMANFTSEDDLTMVHFQGTGKSALAAHVAALFDTSLTWEALSWLRSITTLPVLVKGVLTGEDAELAIQHGAAGILVSNHGGRQLDGALASIEALPEVVEAVNGRCEVYLDGGIRRGTDVLKALALGARAVLVGRPILWGLGANGEAGARHVLELLRAELELAMALAGRPRLAEIDRSLVKMLPN